MCLPRIFADAGSIPRIEKLVDVKILVNGSCVTIVLIKADMCSEILGQFSETRHTRRTPLVSESLVLCCVCLMGRLLNVVSHVTGKMYSLA